MPNVNEQLPELTNEHLSQISTALRTGKASSNHIRINVVGNQGVGKTTLVQRLQRSLTSCESQNPDPTEALDIDRITLRCIQSANAENTEWQTNPEGNNSNLFDLVVKFL